MNQKIKRIRQIAAAFVLVAAGAGFSACEKYTFIPEVVNPEEIIYLSTDIQPIFTAKCATCHTAVKAPDLREGKSHAALLKGSYVTLPGETSELYTKMIGTDHAPKSSDADKQKVLIWINQGALNN